MFKNILTNSRRRCAVGISSQANSPELINLPLEAPLVGPRHAVDPARPLGRPRPRVLERGRLGVVVHEIGPPVFRVAHLPAGREGDQVEVRRDFLALRPRIFPLRRAVPVVHEVDAALGLDAALPTGRQGPQAVVLFSGDGCARTGRRLVRRV